MRTDLFLAERLNLFVVFVELLVVGFDLLLELILGVFASVEHASLTQLKHGVDVIRPVKHCAVQLYIFIYKNGVIFL